MQCSMRAFTRKMNAPQETGFGSCTSDSVSVRDVAQVNASFFQSSDHRPVATKSVAVR